MPGWFYRGFYFLHATGSPGLTPAYTVAIPTAYLPGYYCAFTTDGRPWDYGCVLHLNISLPPVYLDIWISAHRSCQHSLAHGMAPRFMLQRHTVISVVGTPAGDARPALPFAVTDDSSPDVPVPRMYYTCRVSAGCHRLPYLPQTIVDGDLWLVIPPAVLLRCRFLGRTIPHAVLPPFLLPTVIYALPVPDGFTTACNLLPPHSPCSYPTSYGWSGRYLGGKTKKNAFCTGFFETPGLRFWCSHTDTRKGLDDYLNVLSRSCGPGSGWRPYTCGRATCYGVLALPMWFWYGQCRTTNGEPWDLGNIATTNVPHTRSCTTAACPG